MYKKYNFKANSLSPLNYTRRQPNYTGQTLSAILERITPLLIVAATFIWLWK